MQLLSTFHKNRSPHKHMILIKSIFLQVSPQNKWWLGKWVNMFNLFNLKRLNRYFFMWRFSTLTSPNWLNGLNVSTHLIKRIEKLYLNTLNFVFGYSIPLLISSKIHHVCPHNMWSNTGPTLLYEFTNIEWIGLVACRYCADTMMQFESWVFMGKLVWNSCVCFSLTGMKA